MKFNFSQLKKRIYRKFSNCYKKPMIAELAIGTLLCFIVLVLSLNRNTISGFATDLVKPQVNENLVFASYSDEEYDADEYDADEYDASSLSRDDSLSAPSYTKKTSTPKKHSSSESNTYSYTSRPSTQAQEQIHPTEEDESEIIEAPSVTIFPEATEEPEPEVILDPNGPVISCSFEQHHISESFGEAVKLTGYNSNGNKLDSNHFIVALNNKKVPLKLSYNQSNYYYLNYDEGINDLSVIIVDDNNAIKHYEYTIDYKKPDQDRAVISIDSEILGLGYMVLPTSVEIVPDQPVSYYVKSILSNNGYTTFSSGSYKKNYSLNGIYKPGLYTPVEPMLGRDFIFELSLQDITIRYNPDNYYTDFLKNGYFSDASSWVFLINGEIHTDSMSDYILKDNDVLNVCFSVANGKDLLLFEELNRQAAEQSQN